MAAIIKFYGKNQLGYSHVVCSDCGCSGFTIETDDSDGIERFKWLHCMQCGNNIPVEMSPCFGPKKVMY